MLLTATLTTTATAWFHLISYSTYNCHSPSRSKLDNAESVTHLHLVLILRDVH
jgi:hypothetical protein